MKLSKIIKILLKNNKRILRQKDGSVGKGLATKPNEMHSVLSGPTWGKDRMDSQVVYYLHRGTHRHTK